MTDTKNPFETFETVSVESAEDRERERLAYLAPTVAKIAEADSVVQFKLASEGLNGELEKLRRAANFQGRSLRIVSRKPQEDGQTILQVKLGAKITRKTAAEVAAAKTADASPEVASAPEGAATPAAPKPSK